MLREKQNLSFANYIKAFLLAITASMSMLISNGTYPATQQIKEQLGSRLAIMIWQIRSSFNDVDYPFLLIIVLLFAAFVYLIPKVKKQNIKYGIPFAVIASLFILLCDSYAETDSWDNVFGSTTALVTSGLRGVGIATIAFFVFDLINRINIEKLEIRFQNNRKLFFTLFIIMSVCWIPYMIIAAPGNMNNDITDQLAQITGNADICWTKNSLVFEPGDILLNNHHPVLHTLIIGLFFKIGEAVGSYFFGMELYAVIQSLAFAATLTYLVVKLKSFGLPSNLAKLVYVFFTFLPIFPMWGMTLMKDTTFTIAFTITTILLYESFLYPEKFTKKKYFALMIILILLMMLRNNGFYLILFLIPFVAIHFRKDKKFLLKIVSVLLIPMLIFKIGYSGALFNNLGIKEGSLKEMLSVPFQQTARYITEYQDEITLEEEKAILTVLGGGKYSLSDISEKYVPDRSDNVKATYNKYADTDDLINYFKVWFNQFTKHPLVYVEAFLNLNYSWFSFDNNWDNIYYNGIDKTISKNFEGLENIESLNGERTIINQAILLLDKIPLVNCLFEFSFYTWIYVIAFISMLIRKKHKELLTCLPFFANYIICFLGPVAYIRYALPMIVCAPFVIFITFSKKKNECYNQKDKITGEENEIWIK